LLTISSASPAGTAPGPDELPVIAWERLLGRFTDLFTRPSSGLFLTLVTGWALCPGRRTVTRMVDVADPDGVHAHNAYHRCARGSGRWPSSGAGWQPLLVSHLEGNLRLVLDLDDTLFHKAGRKVNGAGSFRDPIRSRGQRTVFAHGLNLVVLTLRVQPPWGGEPIGLPINMRRYSERDGRSLLDLGQEMIEEVAGWLPDHSFILGCDGAYSSLAGRELPRTHVVSRIQRNAALYEPAPPRQPGQRGRPRKKGARLGTPQELAQAADDWNITDIDVRGEQVELALWARPLLWYAVRPLQQVMLVVVADPDQREHDDLLFCTDLAIPPELVASLYYGRWSIEVTIRDTKQLLGGQEPQCWKARGPERAAALSFWTYSAVWLWYLACHGARPTWRTRPWYTAKRTPSFADALAALRRALWSRRIFDATDPASIMAKFLPVLIDAIAEAA
jgi:DDE superfamily endonuclease